MGLILSVLILKDCGEARARAAVEKFGGNACWNLAPAECSYLEYGSGVQILLNDMCCGYDDMTREISRELSATVMLCFIYDEDYWGYDLFENGEEIDCFNPMPDYFEEISEEEKRKLAGNSKVIAESFGVDEDKIKGYLVEWNEDILDGGETAYEGDEFAAGDAWQMADFMDKIGYPYEW